MSLLRVFVLSLIFQFGITPSFAQLQTSSKQRGDHKAFEDLGKQLQQASQNMQNKGDQNKKQGQGLQMAGKGMELTGMGILVGGEKLVEAGYDLYFDVALPLQANPLTYPAGVAMQSVAEGMVTVGENNVAFGIGFIASGMAMDVAGNQQENKGDGEKADGNQLNSKSGQANVDADQRRTIDGQTGLLSNGNHANEEFTPNSTDSNGDGKISTDEFKATVDPGVLAALARHGALDSSVSGALGEGELTAKMKDLFTSNYPVPGSVEFDSKAKEIDAQSDNIQNQLAKAGLKLESLGIDPSKLEAISSEHSAKLAAALNGDFTGLMADGEGGKNNTSATAHTDQKNMSSQEVSSALAAAAGQFAAGQSIDAPALGKVNFASLFNFKNDGSGTTGKHLGSEGQGWFAGQVADSPHKSIFAVDQRTPTSLGLRAAMPFLFVKVTSLYGRNRGTLTK